MPPASLSRLWTWPSSLSSSPFAPTDQCLPSQFLRPLPRHPRLRLASAPLPSSPRPLAGTEGSTLVPRADEEEDARNVRHVLRVLDLLQSKRDMSFNEVRLTIAIEDPRDIERRQQLGVEDERGCSRDEMAAALVDVYEGRVPSDRLILRELAKELLSWPGLEDEAYERKNPLESPYAKVTDTGVDPVLAAQRAKIDWDAAADIQPGDEVKKIGQTLPPAVGFSVLYLFSAFPIFIGVAVVVILFLNSLQ